MNLWEYELSFAITELQKLKVADSAKHFSKALSELVSIIEKYKKGSDLVRKEIIPLLSWLYEYDRCIGSDISARSEIFTPSTNESIDKFSDPEKNFLLLMKENFNESDSLLWLLEKFRKEFPRDLGVRCAEAYAITIEAYQQQDDLMLLKARKLYENCGSSINSIDKVSLNRFNLIFYTIEILYIKERSGLLQEVIEEAIASEWILKSNLRDQLITLGAIYKTALNLSNGFAKKMQIDYDDLRRKISDQDSRLLEILAVFVAILTIVAGVFSTLQSEAPFLEKKAFIELLTVAMLGSLSFVIFLLTSDSCKKITSAIAFVGCALLFFLIG